MMKQLDDSSPSPEPRNLFAKGLTGGGLGSLKKASN
jgi:hypothetical protein